MNKSISFVTKDKNNQDVTYTFTDEYNELVIEWLFNINRTVKPELTINFRGHDIFNNPLYYFINGLIMEKKLTSLNNITKVIIITDKGAENEIDAKDITNIQSSSSEIEVRVTITLENIDNYPDLIGLATGE